MRRLNAFWSSLKNSSSGRNLPSASELCRGKPLSDQPADLERAIGLRHYRLEIGSQSFEGPVIADVFHVGVEPGGLEEELMRGLRGKGSP